jgi:hypothetical protein
MGWSSRRASRILQGSHFLSVQPITEIQDVHREQEPMSPQYRLPLYCAIANPLTSVLGLTVRSSKPSLPLKLVNMRHTYWY